MNITGHLVRNAISGTVRVSGAAAQRQLEWDATRTELGVPAHTLLKQPTDAGTAAEDAAMTPASRRRALVAIAACCAAPLLARAQFSYDVPYVPTPPVVVEEMLRLANVGPDDFVMDLGSGDGRVVIAAVRKFGARGIGVDLDPDRIAESVYSARLQGVTDRVAFHREDLFKFDISQATVVTMYLLPSVNIKLRPRLLKELKPGTRIVSHDFDMEDWKPDEKSTVRKNVFLWIVPAQIEGTLAHDDRAACGRAQLRDRDSGRSFRRSTVSRATKQEGRGTVECQAARAIASIS